MNILGISAYYHDSAAALIRNGEILSAAQEERFTRIKNDACFPTQSIQFCLRQGGISLREIDAIAFYDKPLLKFERLLETYLAFCPRGLPSFLAAIPVWLKDKLLLKKTIQAELSYLSEIAKNSLPQILFAEHHQSHAASAFFPSPFQNAAVLCLDGVGEWTTTSVWRGAGNILKPQWELHFPHSLGLLYSAFTYYTGFKVNSGEYKVMGLAPYGEPRFVNTIYEKLIDLKADGSFRLNLKYFDFATGLKMTNSHFHSLFGGPPRKPESPLTQKEMDLARSIQVVTEEVVLRLSRTVYSELGEENLCLAGGVALNCVANGRISRESAFKKIWIQPAAGDSGGAIGAALATWYQYYESPRTVPQPFLKDAMQGGFLGPEPLDKEIELTLQAFGARYLRLEEDELIARTVEILSEQNVVGWVQGRMEFGPRSLGARSILGDPRNPKMQSQMNKKIKFRESFRPFAPAVLEEKVSDYFDFEGASPYMLFVAPVKASARLKVSTQEESLFGIDKLNLERSTIPAVTHVDFSARIQTVGPESNPRFRTLLEKFYEKTRCPVLINTSFNVRGEPIVCSPQDAYRCFMRTEMDYLVIGNFILDKKNQPALAEGNSWKKQLSLD